MNPAATAQERTTVSAEAPHQELTAFAVLAAISFAHFLNDIVQSLLPAIYPLLKTSFDLSFGQIGLMTLALMLTATAPSHPATSGKPSPKPIRLLSILTNARPQK